MEQLSEEENSINNVPIANEDYSYLKLANTSLKNKENKLSLLDRQESVKVDTSIINSIHSARVKQVSFHESPSFSQSFIFKPQINEEKSDEIFPQEELKIRTNLRKSLVAMFESEFYIKLQIWFHLFVIILFIVETFYELPFIIYILAAICSLETCFKVLAFGLYSRKSSFLKRTWNYFDLAFIVGSILGSYFEQNLIVCLKYLKVLVFLKDMQIMRVLLQVIEKSISNIIGIILFLFVMLIYLSLFGLSFWEGSLAYRCSNEPWPVNGNLTYEGPEICFSNNNCFNYCSSILEFRKQGKYFIDPSVNLSDIYKRYDLNYGYSTFDDIFSGIFTIFQSITLKKWIDMIIMYSQTENEIVATMYFCLVIIIIRFFVLNFTIGLIIKAYALNFSESELHEKSTSQLYTYYEQMFHKKSAEAESLFKSFFNFQLFSKLRPVRNYHRKNKLAFFLFLISKQPIFDMFINVCVSLNIIVLSFDRLGLSKEEENFYYSCNFVFVIVFCTEVLILLIANGPLAYFRKKERCLDFVIVLISLLEIIFSNSSFLSSFRAFRSFRILKLLSKFKVIELTLTCIKEAIINIANFCILVMIFLIMFALVGHRMYSGKFKFNSDGLYDKAGTSPLLNFDDLLNSFLNVFIVFIADGWPSIFYDCLKTDVNKLFTHFYFFVMLSLLNLLILNLFIAFFLTSFTFSRAKYKFNDINKLIARENSAKNRRSKSNEYKFKRIVQEASKLNESEHDNTHSSLNKNKGTTSIFFKTNFKMPENKNEISFAESLVRKSNNKFLRKLNRNKKVAQTSKVLNQVAIFNNQKQNRNSVVKFQEISNFEEKPIHYPWSDYSFWFIHKNSTLSKLCERIVTSGAFKTL